MSKKLLMNNNIKKPCPCCGNLEKECICTTLEELGATALEVDFAIAMKYTGSTFSGSGTTYKTDGGYTWYSVIDSALTSSQMALFNSKMTELGRKQYSEGTDYYTYLIGTNDFYLYWNGTLYGVPNITRLNQLVALTNTQLEQLNTYGKYYILHYDIAYNLNNATLSNNITTISEGTQYTTTITPTDGYSITDVTVTMGGEDITSTVYTNGVITIPSVIGDIEIIVVAEEIVIYNIAYNLTNVTLNNMQETIIENQSYTAIVTPKTNYEITNVTVTMNGVDGTEVLFDTTTNTINIPSVVGNVEITVIAEEVIVEETKESVRANLVKLTSEGFVNTYETRTCEDYGYKNVPMTIKMEGTIECYMIENNYIATIKADGTTKWYDHSALGNYGGTTTTREAIEMLMYYHNNYLYVLSDYLSDTYNTYVFNVVKENSNYLNDNGVSQGTSAKNRTIKFPSGALRGDTSSTVITDWGDGTVNTSLNHTYSSDGVYTVKTKHCPSESGEKIANTSNIKNFLMEVKSLNKNVTNMSYMFYNCNNLTSLDVSNFDASKVTRMNYMFYGCNKLTSLDVSNWNTSNVTTMAYMFFGCTKLTSLDMSNCDVSKVTTLGYDMFNNCKALTDFKAPQNISADISFYDSNNLTHDSLMSIISNLATVSSRKVLRLGSTNKAKLTSDEIAIATAKNWSVS